MTRLTPEQAVAELARVGAVLDARGVKYERMDTDMDTDMEDRLPPEIAAEIERQGAAAGATRAQIDRAKAHALRNRQAFAAVAVVAAEPEPDYEGDIVDWAIGLHSSLHGAGDPWTDKERAVAVAAIENKLRRWTESAPDSPWHVFDEAVRSLLFAVLAEELAERTRTRSILAEFTRRKGERQRPAAPEAPPDLYVVLVTGGRSYDDRALVDRTLDRIRGSIGVLIQGGATGADRLARRWAEANGVPVVEVPALWEAHGHDGGKRRNGFMLTVADHLMNLWPDRMGLGVIAFPGGAGTKDMVDRATEAGIAVRHVW